MAFPYPRPDEGYAPPVPVYGAPELPVGRVKMQVIETGQIKTQNFQRIMQISGQNGPKQSYTILNGFIEGGYLTSLLKFLVFKFGVRTT